MSDILKDFLSTILKDVIDAQHSANIRSSELAKEYSKKNSKDDLLKFFDIPSIRIKSFDFDLKFGLTESGGILDDQIRDDLISHINTSTNSFIQETIKVHELPAESERDIKELISILWIGKDGKDILSKLDLKEDNSFLKKVNFFIENMKISVENLVSENIIFDTQKHSLKAIFNINELNSLNENILCSMRINAEIIGKKAGFISEYDNPQNDENSTNVFLVGE